MEPGLMPRVDKDAEVTLVVLVYRSLRWLSWCMESVESSKQSTRYKWCIVANDATPEVRNDPRITVDWQNADPHAHYISRVYAAWSEGALNSQTPWCIRSTSTGSLCPADCWWSTGASIQGCRSMCATSAPTRRTSSATPS